MAGEIQLNSITMATESSGSITAELDTIRPNTTNGSLTLQGDSSDTGVTGLTIDSSGVVNTTTAKVTNIQATSGQSLTIKDEDGNAAITIGTDNTAAGYLSLNFGSYHGDSGGAGSGTLTGNTLDDYEFGTFTPTYSFSGGGTVTSASNDGTYVKIGKLVHCSFRIRSTSVSGISGNLSILGFPFTAVSNSRSAGSKWFARSWSSDMPNFSFGVTAGTTQASVYKQAMNSSSSTVGTSDFSTGGDSNVLEASITYRVA